MAELRHPRLPARIAGLLYLTVTACALHAYLHVRGQLIDTGDIARTGANLLAQEPFYRAGWTVAVAVVLCNPPLGVILHAVLRIVDRQLALLALVFTGSSLSA